MEKIKLVVWDADNTLWDGTVFYKDRENVKLKPGTKEALKELEKRGVKSTICSKNYYEDVDSVLKIFEIEKYFEHPQVGWGLKSDAIKKLAEIFKVDFKEIAFIDDDMFQIAEVKSQLPGVNAASLDDPIDILNFDGIRPESPTKEDIRRVQLLKEDRDRKQAEVDFKGDYKDFLRQCSMVMSVRSIEENDWERVCQLLNRTNELNATNNRYTLEELKKSHKENNDIVFVVELTDKFGEYGIIGESIIARKDYGWFIRDLTVSCRTMGRGIGSALLLVILNCARESGIKKVIGMLTETESNWRIKPLYENRGFDKVSVEGSKTFYEFCIDRKEIPSYPDWIKINMLLKKEIENN